MLFESNSAHVLAGLTLHLINVDNVHNSCLKCYIIMNCNDILLDQIYC